MATTGQVGTAKSYLSNVELGSGSLLAAARPFTAQLGTSNSLLSYIELGDAQGVQMGAANLSAVGALAAGSRRRIPRYSEWPQSTDLVWSST